MIKIILAIAVLSGSSAFAAGGAKIKAVDFDGVKFVIALDAEGEPRVNGDKRTYPTIKDFREEADYASWCYEGTKQEVRGLLEDLVSEANGDGDSWAELVSIKSDRRGKFEVLVNITDESGENEESFSFSPCK